MAYSPNTWNNGDIVTKPKLDRLEAAVADSVATTDAPELIRDTMAAALVAGSNVTITPNDGSDTITIAYSGSGNAGVVIAAVSTSNTAAQNSAALNAAVTAAYSGGGYVLIPAGTFDHNGFTLPVRGRIAITGSGRGVTVLRNVHATNASITAAGVGGGVDPVFPYCQDWTISDLTLSASAVRTVQVGIDILLANRYSVSDVTVVDHGVGFRNKASWESTFHTVTAYTCTIGYHFPSPAPYTVSCPVTVINGSAIYCGTAVKSDDSVESLSWHGGDFSFSTAGAVLLGSQTRVITFTGVNFEQVTNDCVTIGDATNGPTGVNLIGCRFLQHTFTTGERAINFIKGDGVNVEGCWFGNYDKPIEQGALTGTLTVSGTSEFGSGTFLTTAGRTYPVGAYISTPAATSDTAAGAKAVNVNKTWGGTSTVGPFSLTYTLTLANFTSMVGSLYVGGASFNNGTNRVAYLGTLLVSAKNNATDAWAAYVTAAGTPVGLAAGPTVAVTGTGDTRTLTVTFTASNNDIWGGSCAVSLIRQ